MSSISKDLRSKTNDELAEIVSRLKGQLLEMRFKVANGEQDKLHTIKIVRRTIAVALTILNERDIQIHFNNSADVFKNSSIGHKINKETEASTSEATEENKEEVTK